MRTTCFTIYYSNLWEDKDEVKSCTVIADSGREAQEMFYEKYSDCVIVRYTYY